MLNGLSTFILIKPEGRIHYCMKGYYSCIIAWSWAVSMCALSTSPNQFANLNINCMTAHIFTAFERSYMYEGLNWGGSGIHSLKI